MKKAILIGFGFTIGAKLVKLLELGCDYCLLGLMANNDEFATFLETNCPNLTKKIEMLRNK